MLDITGILCLSISEENCGHFSLSGRLEVEKVDVVLHINKLQNTKSKLLMTVKRKCLSSDMQCFLRRKCQTCLVFTVWS